MQEKSGPDVGKPIHNPSKVLEREDVSALAAISNTWCRLHLNQLHEGSQFENTRSSGAGCSSSCWHQRR